jgi:hypothetical protein
MATSEYNEGEPDRLDDILRVLSAVLHLDDPDDHEQRSTMCQTLSLIGLVESEWLDDELIHSYTATPELVRLVWQSKEFVSRTRQHIENGRRLARRKGLPEDEQDDTSKAGSSRKKGWTVRLDR